MERQHDKETEFRDIILTHSRLINRICYFYSSVKHPFEDLRQEVYVNLWQGLDKFRGDSKISTWIYRVAVNSVLMVLRSPETKIDTVSVDKVFHSLSSEFDDEQKDRLAAVYALINRLETVEKAIILLWLDDTPYDEIADIMGLKRNTVATKIRRIKEKLSKHV